MSPKLTIAIPTLNRCQLLRRAVQSALDQTAQDIEILVSNNGSTDDTRQVLDEFSDPRLRIVHHDITIDACSHGNWLVKQARGELFLGLSDDDYLEPEFASEVIRFFATHPDTSFVYTGCEIHYANISVPAKLGPTIESGADFFTAFLGGQRDVCWCACVTRTLDLRSIGEIPPNTICGDMYYWTKLALRGQVGCIRKTLSHYIAFRNDGDNHSTGSPVLAWATEVAALTDFMVQARHSIREHSDDGMHLGREFLARSSAGQFVWNALRGRSRVAMLRDLWKTLPYLRGGKKPHWIHIAAAILAPRKLLLSRVLAASVRKSRSIRSKQTG